MHVELMREPGKEFPVLPSPNAVETLRVWHCKYRTLAQLSKFTNLQGLEVASFPDDTLDSVGELHGLRYLRILHLRRVTQLTPLRNLRSLITLRLDTLPSWDASRKKTIVESLAPLAALEDLRHIELFGVVPADGSLRPLQALALTTARFHLVPKAEVKRFYAATGVANAHSPPPNF